MSLKIDEIKDKADAERVSEIIIRSLTDDEINFNPFQGSIFVFDDGSIRFKGDAFGHDEAVEKIARHVWENRKTVNKQIRKWEKFGSRYVNCGC